VNWIELTDEQQLATIKQNSALQPVVIFKHSTRCSISTMAKNRLEKQNPIGNTQFYFLDLLRHRALSNKIARDFAVVHESPQVLLIRNGECVYEETHNGITIAGLAEAVFSSN
jgi:bacillithiol system protein YtxJ